MYKSLTVARGNKKNGRRQMKDRFSPANLALDCNVTGRKFYKSDERAFYVIRYLTQLVKFYHRFVHVAVLHCPLATRPTNVISNLVLQVVIYHWLDVRASVVFHAILLRSSLKRSLKYIGQRNDWEE